MNQAKMHNAGKKVKTGIPVSRKTLKLKKKVGVSKINTKHVNPKFAGVKFPVKFHNATKIKGKEKGKKLSRKPALIGGRREFKQFMM